MEHYYLHAGPSWSHHNYLVPRALNTWWSRTKAATPVSIPKDILEPLPDIGSGVTD